MAVGLAQQLAQNTFAFNDDKASVDATSNGSANILLHELQLGEQLNESVAQTRRADFSLMLAMLAEDVREQSLFVLPKATSPEVAEQSNQALRKAFNLPNQAPLGLKSLEDIGQFNQVNSIVENNIADIHLTNVLVPKPLSFRDDKHHLPNNVLQNTSVSCQLKHENVRTTNRVEALTEVNNDKLVNDTINKPLSFNAKGWLEGIQQSLVKAPLIN